MAIRVICPGCMTSFEVDDRFAGKKGPCPKCGHIIEIPKEKLVVHAPDDITVGGKKQKILGHDARPILQKRFAFTGKQVALGVLVAIAYFGIAFAVGLAHSGVFSAIVGTILAFAIAFPIADVGYMLIRDDNDLEMFLGNERHRRALFASLVFAGSWLVFEVFLYFLGGTGPMACLFLIPIAAVGSFGALIFFDCNFGRALLVYLIFAFAAIIGRGLILAPNGWIWQESRRSVATSKDVPAKPAPETPAEEKTDAQESTASEKPAAAPAEKPKPPISREAPKVNPNRRRM